MSFLTQFFVLPHFLTQEKSFPDLLALQVSPWDFQTLQEHCLVSKKSRKVVSKYVFFAQFLQ